MNLKEKSRGLDEESSGPWLFLIYKAVSVNCFFERGASQMRPRSKSYTPIASAASFIA